MQYLDSLNKIYGPLVRISPNEVVLSDLQATKDIHRVGTSFRKSDWYSKLTTAREHNIFSLVDPKAHQERRRLLSHPLSEGPLRELEPVVLENVELAIRKIQERMDTDGSADLLKWFFFMATDIIGQLSFGESFRMLEYGKETQYSIDLKNVTFYNALLVEIPLIMKVVSAIPCSFIKNITSAAARRTAYAENLLNRYRQYLKSNPDCEKPMLLSRELKAHDAGQISHDVIESDAEAYILGGSDTTAITLTYLVWVVSEHPAVQQRLIREVRSLPDGFKADDLKKLSYMGQVIEESLRLYGAAPGDLPRAVPAGGKRLCGHYIPGGLTVTTQAFDPSRWENPTQDMKDAFMPFGAGSRICLGLHLARLELRMTIAHFHRAFPKGVRLTDGMTDGDMEMENYFLIQPKARRCKVARA
ncbi:cytochrome P450 [Aspergillus chevalieri]|uniref:Cytochrome P450 n=1 Tax=Aspergillus chevalieri TaxID=182096 RepID=A0A7R7VKF4_ASPCH|nr:uncharacterized protein ACHE_20981S [Aspergillus chevalieri]BCR85523.1 hypothetical protein ACHE_20981S [Aspergillus chevalieri]